MTGGGGGGGVFAEDDVIFYNHFRANFCAIKKSASCIHSLSVITHNHMQPNPLTWDTFNFKKY